MYRNAYRNASGCKPRLHTVMRYRGPTWEPWGLRSIVEEGIGLASPAVDQFVILPRQGYWRGGVRDVRGTFLSPLKWDSKVGLDQFSALHHVAHANAVNLYWRIGESLCLLGNNRRHVRCDTASIFCVYVASSQAAYARSSRNSSEVWILAVLFQCIICEAANGKVVWKWDNNGEKKNNQLVFTFTERGRIT